MPRSPPTAIFMSKSTVESYVALPLCRGWVCFLVFLFLESLPLALLQELTEQSDSACTSVLDYLMKRLRAKAPRVKLKALVVMKNCIEKGHPTFRQELQLRAEEVRAELGCSGPADPHEGDGPYRRVREEADKVLNMMYDEQYAQVREGV